MVRLTRHGAPVAAVFDLLGQDENDLTAALGFTLAQSPALLKALLAHLWPAGPDVDPDDIAAALEVRGEVGRTDLEITFPGAALIIEAKRDWLLPSFDQLARYAPRVAARGGGALVTLSQASRPLAATQLPTHVGGIPVVHLPWREVLDLIKECRRHERGHARSWLDQFQTYLNGVIRVRSVSDSWTYCVVLSNDRPSGGGSRTFVQYVTDELTYFHPYGVGGWPTEPPNFMAFRWKGAVHRIHRVIQADVVPSLLDRWPDIPATEDSVRPHAVYELGPRLPPFEPIANGASYRAARLWVLLDQLQCSDTLANAMAGTRQLTGRG
jgi:hypothetical protein